MGILDFLCYAFIVVVFFQILYYLFFLGRFAFLKHQETDSQNIPVSVIICAKNEAENLKTFLPSILEQDYHNFEIVLINDASQDDSLNIMKAFASKHSNIKLVDVKNIEAFWGNKKYALTLGIKAATHNHLLFTDADCKPVSKHWITEMVSHFSTNKTIVLGYGAYAKIKNSFLNKLIRFETFITAIQYFSFAKLGMPYMGVGRNLAYTKTDFFKVRGFMNHMKIRSGDDDLFINEAANSRNTEICFSKNSFTTSNPETNYKSWIRQKRRHISTAKHYKQNHKVLLASIYVFNFLFWILAIILLAFQFNLQVVLSLFLLRIIAQYFALGFSSKKLDEKDLIFFFPILEFFLIILQLTIFINNLVSKPNHWK
ncbi:glycosyltransferase [Hwangdonia lutea]|uniref:Glycosyltransferase n=1 Tax=Hwangdonia lutea TaxID=3075823 RepID=A0AA97EJ38_9FLAO|nr:glycosyltransferase [Hwangdonia sp. SCSIO 19198]WOD42399.1 glycosyltransferase [Hwangdonia sp. SCSIO 19198]